MTRHLLLHLAVVGCVGFLAAGQAQAQYGYGNSNARGIPSYSRPAVSPYLGLLNNNNSTAYNYFNIVRPQMQYNNAIQGLSQQVGQNQQNITALGANAGILSTGHPAVFLNLSHYYGGTGARAGAGGQEKEKQETQGKGRGMSAGKGKTPGR